MHLDGRFGLTKARPEKYAQAQADGGIERIDGLHHIHREAVVVVKLFGGLD